MGWTSRIPGFDALDPNSRATLDRLIPQKIPTGTVLFHPGDSVQGYVVPLSGRIDVCLTNAQGRDILLYEVGPGQSCVQSTLGLMGGEDYSAEARAETEVEMVFLPKPVFLDLIDRSAAFRTMVLATFAGRLQSMMHLLEKVAFLRVEARLAAALLSQSDVAGVTHETQAELATRIGSTREVVARQLANWNRAGLIESGRGRIALRDRDALEARAGVDG